MRNIFFVHLFLFGTIVSQSQDLDNSINIIYGSHHLYTVETPAGWINDTSFAQAIGLTNFFYNLRDTSSADKSYMFTNGYDKEDENENIETFVKADIIAFLKKYPAATYGEVDINF